MEEQAPSAPTISFTDIVMNVFASPAEAFEGIRTSPTRASTWLIPIIILIILSSVFTWLIFTNDALKAQVVDAQRVRLEEQVRSGQITQERADQAMEGIDRAGGVFIAFGIIGSVLMISITFFGAGLIFWLVGKVALKAPAGYGKYLELWGATQWIGVLGLVITLLLALSLNSVYASPSGALAVLAQFNPRDTVHRVLSSLNIFSLWQVVVAGIGLAKFSGKSMGTGIGYALGLWVIWVLISVFLLAGLGM